MTREQKIEAEIQAGLSAQKKRYERWKQNREFCYGEADGVPAYEGAVSSTFPIVPQIVDALGAVVVDSITSVPDYMIATCHDDPDASSKIQRVIQFFFNHGSLKRCLKSVNKPTAWANSGWIKVIWDEKRKKFKFRVIEPDSTVVYPAHAECLTEAKLFGDRKYMRRYQIDELVEQGVYKKSNSESSEVELSNERAIQSVAVSKEDEDVEVWEIYRYEKGWKRIVFARDTKRILKEDDVSDIDDFGHAYAEFFYKPKTTQDGFYSADSVVNDLAQLQLDASEIWGDYKTGLKANVFNFFFTLGGMESARKVGQAEPGGIYQLDTDSLVPHNPSADLSSLVPALGMVLEQARRVARISEMASGQDSAGVDTATEASFIAQGQSRSIDEYQQNFSEGLMALTTYVKTVCYTEFDNWQPIYGKELDITPEDKELFSKRVTWKVAVMSVAGTPNANMQTALALAQLAQDPENGIDKRQLTSRILQIAEQGGFTNAESLQQVPDINQKLMELAEAMGVEPELLYEAVIAAGTQQQQADASRVGEMEAGQMLQQLPIDANQVAGEAEGLTSALSPGEDRSPAGANQIA